MPRSKSLAELQVERARLVERIAIQRDTLGQHFVPVAGVLQFGERVNQTLKSAVQFVRSHPLAMGSLAAVLLLRKPRLSLRWVRRGLFFWRSWRTVRSLAQTLPGQIERAMQAYAQPAKYRRK